MPDHAVRHGHRRISSVGTAPGAHRVAAAPRLPPVAGKTIGGEVSFRVHFVGTTLHGNHDFARRKAMYGGEPAIAMTAADFYRFPHLHLEVVRRRVRRRG